MIANRGVMYMLQTYRGYFQDGRFISPELVTIPDNVEVHITIVGSDQPPIKTRAQRQNEALKRFFANIDAIKDEPITDEDMADFERNRVNFKRELDV